MRTWLVSREALRSIAVALSLLATAAVGGCECQPAAPPRCTDDGSSAVEPGAPTWHADVAPIVQARCATCHVDGGNAPFPLTTLAQVREHAEAVKNAVVRRAMPPWMPARCCNDFRDDLSLTDLQVATLEAWVDQGAPEGEPVIAAPLPPVGGLPRVDATLVMSEAYLPDVIAQDDTRCFVLDWPFDDVQFVVGFGVAPGVKPVVHHALVVVAPGSARAGFQAADDVDDEPGWSCPGGVVFGIDGYLGGWSPGWEGQTTPAGTGHQVDPDDVVILTVHYSRPHDDAEIAPDQSSVDLMLADEVDDTLTSIAVYDARWAAGGLPIPAGERDVRYTAEYDPTDVYSFGAPLEILAVNLHMHERGKSGLVAIKRRDGGVDCLVQIDDYRHDLQGDYVFAAPRTIEDGDLAFVECAFDNGPAHQRLVNGLPEEPRDLNWAEDGEMCVAFLTAKKPR